MSAEKWECNDWRYRHIGMTLLLVLVLAVFRELIAELAIRWSTEAQYSHGFAVPLIAIILGWSRRERLSSGRAEAHGFGLLLIFTGMVLHIIARFLYVEGVDCAGLLACLGGILLLVWGSRFVAVMWPAILFLGFMFPLPYRLERFLADPLQLMGAYQAAWFIQALGIPAIAEGSVIHLSTTQLGVEEACSGMRMLMVFVAISAATMIVSERAAWEKMLILFSAIPIALACNIGRIVATAVAHHALGQQTADLIFHDLSGWLMMPTAMGMLYLELRLLDWLIVDLVEQNQQLVLSVIPRNPATASAPS